MPTINEAKFTINGTASTDPTTGDPGFNATTSQTLTLTAEQNPSGALSLLYQVFDTNDSESPLASKDATALTFVGSGTASQTVANPNSSITIVTAATGVHSWIIRCTASTAAGSAIFERIVSIRTATSPAIRKPVSAESEEYEARGLNDTLDDMIDVINAGGAASVTVRKNSGADVGMRPRLNFIEGTNITLTVADDAPNTEVDITIAAPLTLNFWQRNVTTLSPVTGGDDVQITDDAKITTNSNNNLNLIPNGTGFTIVGAGATSHGLNSSNDALVSGEFEVNGPAFLDGTVALAGNTTALDQIQLLFGTGSDAVIVYSTAQTPDSLMLGLSTDSKGIIVCEKADIATDFGHALQTNPTVFIHSADATDTTQWVSLAHDQTDGLIDVGTGDVKLGSNLNLDTSGLKDNDVVTAIALGDGSNLALTTTNKTIVGGINELDLRVDTGPFLNGSILEDHAITVTSDGATVTLSLEKSGGGDLNLIFDGGFTAFDATPIATIALTAGSDTSPQINYIYIPKSTGLLAKSTTAFDNTEQIVHVATVLVQSAGGVQTDGCYKCHAWTDHMVDVLDRGHITHVNEWIRKRPAGWETGVATTPTVGVVTFDVATTSGQVFQLHRHTFPAFNTATGSDIYIVNDNATAFKKVGDLVGELTDSLGGSMSGKDFSLVIWGVQSEASADCKLMCNLPSGSYNLSSQATLDPDKFSDFTIPSDFVGSGFLIARLVVSHSVAAGGTWTLTQNEDIRGQVPQTGAGGATAATTTFADNVFRIFDQADNTKNIAFEASGITTATTRTLTVQDVDGTIALTGTAVSVPDDTTLSFGDSTDAVIEFDTGQTVDTLLFALDSTSRSVVVIEEGDRGFDFAHAAQTDPTVFIHSANQATDEWISITHDQTNGVISTGTGALALGAQVTSHSVNASGDLIVKKLEVNSNAFFDDNMSIRDTRSLVFGSAGTTLTASTVQTPSTGLIGMSTLSLNFLFVDVLDVAFDFAHPLQTNPTIFIHSANQDTTEWTGLAHNQTDSLKSIGKGGHVTSHEIPVNLADDASFDLPTASAGFGFLIAGDAEEYASFAWDSGAVVTLVTSSANVVSTDTDTKFCIFDNGTAVRIRNRLGAAKDVVFDYHYTTP